jgi:uncharacterized membrane protein YphA (DoxX/SURF4 family)
MVAPSPGPVSWLRCFFLRTAALYLLLWAFPFPLNVLPFFDWLESAHRHLMEAVGLLALRVTTGFAGPLPSVENGSGDRLDSWVAQLGILLVSLAGGALWAAFGRTATRQARIADASRLYLRYFLAAAMLIYGASKLTLNQFPPPSVDRLVQPLGEGSPMGLVWTMIGLSPAYQFVGGLLEFIAGLLLLSRRGVSLGAWLMAGVMAHVVLLNYCFDVPVKIYSTQLLLGALLLAAPDVPGLLDLLVRRRPAQPIGEPVARLAGWRRFSVYGGNTLLVALTCFVAGIAEAAPVLPEVYATYEVTAFTRDGVAVPPRFEDPLRWRYFTLTNRGTAIVRSVGGARQVYTAKVDVAAKTMTLTARDQAPEISGLTYTQTTPAALSLSCHLAGAVVEVQLRRRLPDEFLMVNRGFHWINPAPFNR